MTDGARQVREMWRATQNNPAARDELRRTFINYQRGVDYFEYYRRGWLRYWDDDQREQVYTRYPIPANSQTFPDESISDPNRPVPRRPTRPFSEIRRIDDGAGREVPGSMRRRVEALGFRLVKILGAGSQGLAVLFESANDGSKAVFKWSTEIFSTAMEMWCMRKMVGARHIIQVRICLNPPKLYSGSPIPTGVIIVPALVAPTGDGCRHTLAQEKHNQGPGGLPDRQQKK